MRPRYRIRFAGMPSAKLVRWLQDLIPVLREAPKDVRVDVEITSTVEPETDPRRDEAS